MKQAIPIFVLIAMAMVMIAASVVTVDRLTRRIGAIERQLQRFEEQQYNERLHMLETRQEP